MPFSFLIKMNSLEKIEILVNLELPNYEFIEYIPVDKNESPAPFVLVNNKKTSVTSVAFVYGKELYNTPFTSPNPAIISRLRTIILLADTFTSAIDIETLFCKKGIFLSKLDYDEETSEISFNTTSQEIFLINRISSNRKIDSLFKDLRDLLYV